MYSVAMKVAVAKCAAVCLQCCMYTIRLFVTLQ